MQLGSLGVDPALEKKGGRANSDSDLFKSKGGEKVREWREILRPHSIPTYYNAKDGDGKCSSLGGKNQ